MITGQIKSQIDQIWETFWTGGITNSITLLEQMTYLLFMKMLDDAQIRQERDAVFMIQNPRTLVKVVDGISSLDMNNRDAMGDVYEYVLGKMAASGTNGQFRTPRHIIRMMVELMQPTLDDTICDPAMGSAGFIVESAKYLQEHYKKELGQESHVTKLRN